MNLFRRFFRDEDGPTSVEYAVMLGLIVVVCLVVIRSIGTAHDKAKDPAAVIAAQGAPAKQFLIVVGKGEAQKHPLVVVADDEAKAHAIGKRIAVKTGMDLVSVEELAE